MKFLLVVPRVIRKPGDSYVFPLGMAYIASAIKSGGHEIHCVNLNNDYRPIEYIIEEAVDEFEPDACGTGTLSALYSRAKEIFDTVRAIRPNIINIAGGGMISSAPVKAGTVMDFDFGVIGEGEETIIELADAISSGSDPRGVPGLALRDREGNVGLTHPRDPIRDIDALPWPDYEAFGIDHWSRLERPGMIHMISSRSCPYSCSYCFHPLGRGYRTRSLDGFFAEFDHLYQKFGVKELGLADELFALRKDRILEFCDRIRPYGVKWHAALHVKSVDEQAISAMKECGCVGISYGVESANADVLKSMRKKTTRSDIDRALRLTFDNHITMQANLIFGDLAETIETANDSLNWWANNREFQINLIPLRAYPGSPMFDKLVAQGRVAKDANWFTKDGENFSRIDDASYGDLVTRLMVFNETLLMPAKVLRFEREAEDDPLLGPLHDIAWLCPRCNTVNEISHHSVRGPWAFQSIRMPCSECGSRLDIQNLTRPPWPHPEADNLYRQAVELRQAGQIHQAFDLYKQILHIPIDSASFNRPDAIAKASYDLGLAVLDYGSNPKDAVAPLMGSVLVRAYDPMRHLALGRALLAEGLPGAAKLHFQQVIRLLTVADAANPATIQRIEEIIASIPEIDPFSGYVGLISATAPSVETLGA